MYEQNINQKFFRIMIYSEEPDWAIMFVVNLQVFVGIKTIKDFIARWKAIKGLKLMELEFN